MASFNPNLPVHPDGKFWVQAFRDRQANGESFAYEAEYVAPTNIRSVWSAVQRIEYFEEWFFGNGSSRATEKVGDSFGLGQPTPGNRAIIVQCSLAEGFVFRQNDAFFHLKLTDYGPAATLMTLRCFDFHDRRPGVLSRAILSMSARSDSDQSSDNEGTRRRLVRLSHLTDDLSAYGQPISGVTQGGKALNWIEWGHGAGVLHVLPDEHGKGVFETGRICREGKIAYVVPDHLSGAGHSERYYIENWYVQCYTDGRIIHIKKNHGDKVLPGDRLVLLES